MSINSSAQEGSYEYGIVKVEKDDIVIDAGANIGEFSAYSGIKGAYAFEPNRSVIVEYLQKTAAWNKNIKICEYALSNTNGLAKFILHDSIGQGSLALTEKLKNHPTQKSVEVKSITLDDFVKQNSLPRVDFIKADIEGAERYMLMDAKNVLKEFAPKISICTYHLPDDPQILRELILDANPNYVIEERWKKMYAHVPK